MRLRRRRRLVASPFEVRLTTADGEEVVRRFETYQEARGAVARLWPTCRRYAINEFVHGVRFNKSFGSRSRLADGMDLAWDE